jgi:hypothetical protein
MVGDRFEQGRDYVLAVEYDKLVDALVAVCERGDTDHSAKSMYWIASDALKAAGYDGNGKHLAHSGEAKS